MSDNPITPQVASLNATERKVYEHFLAGSERGDLYNYVKRGKAGLPGPHRSQGNAYAAWLAGRQLATLPPAPGESA